MMSEDINRIDRTVFDPIRINPNYKQPGNPPKRRDPGKHSCDSHPNEEEKGTEIGRDEGATDLSHQLDIEV